jgi:hypothetical protein
VYDNLVGLTLPLLFAIAVLVVGIGPVRRIIQRLFAGLQQACDTDAESTALRPAAVGKRRIVRSWGGEVPIWICCIESCAVSVSGVSVADMATMTTSGCRGIFGGEGFGEWKEGESIMKNACFSCQGWMCKKEEMVRQMV